MKKFKIYLDNCCFNRPYDDQTLLKIELETKAKLFIQNLIANKKIDLVWSYILDYENSKNIYKQNLNSIQKWQSLSCEDIDESLDVLKISKDIQKSGIKNADSLHMACAIVANCDYFITVDKRILKYNNNNLFVCDPLSFLRIWEVKSYDE